MASPMSAPLKPSGLMLKNRIAFSPMLMYMADEQGCANDRHFTRYGARALGGTALIMSEVVAVAARAHQCMRF